MSNGKAMISCSVVGLIKQMLYKMSQWYFPKPCKRFGRNVKVELGLCHYTTKAELKWATGVDTSNLVAKPDLVRLKAQVNTVDADKLKTVPVDLSELINVNNVVKKRYGKLVAKVNTINTSGFVLKT